MKKTSLYAGLFSLLLTGMYFVPTTLNAYEATKIKPNFIKVNAVKYRRAAAESAQLASVGSKKGRVGKVPTYQRKKFWSGGTLNVTQDTILTLTTEQVNTLMASGHTAHGSVSGSMSSTNSGNFVLAKYSLEDSNVISKINGMTKNQRKSIKKIDRGRIITSIWVLISGEEQQSGNYSGTLSMSNQTSGEQVTFTNSSRSTFSFSPNTIIAYEYKKLKWKNKKKVKKLETDGVWR